MRRPQRPHANTAEDYAGPSKSMVKRELHALQDLALELLELPESRLDALIADERLRGALRELRRIEAHSARKRQMQYVGKLLRDEDLAPLREALAARRAGHATDTRLLHEIEGWRGRLLADPAALDEWAQAFPASATREFRSLVADARRERDGPAGRGRAFRELFKGIRAAVEATRGGG